MTKTDQFGKDLARFALAPAPDVPRFYTTAMLNWLGCAMAGARQSATARVAAYCLTQAQSGLRPPIGRSERLVAPAAVLVDCLSSASLAYDDIHFETTLHPAGPVAAAIFGLARVETIPGDLALAAFRVGMEVECRSALAMFAGTAGGARGWYATGLTGGLGAAAAVGRLMRLDQPQMEAALGLAAARAGGTRGTHGSMAAHVVPGLAAESGFVAAGLARTGFSCGIGALTGANGLLRLVAGEPDLDLAGAGLGESHVCEATACKPYPFGFIAHATIRCCLDLAALPRQNTAGPVRVELSVSPTAALLGGNPMPATVFEAHVALRYIAARVLTDPRLAFEPLDEDFVVRADIAAMMPRIEITADPRLADAQAVCTAVLANGRRIEIRCDEAPGSPGNPPGADETEAKFLRLVTPVIGTDRADAWQAAVAGMADCQDISRLLAP